MQLPPTSVLSAWPAPNLVNPETRGPAEIITVSVLLVLVTILLCIRVYTRLWVSNGFGLDDVLILLAYLPTTAFAIISFVVQVDFDWGRHVWDLPFNLITPSLKFSLASQLMFDLATTLTKLSMLSLIYRVVSVNNSRYRYVVVSLAVVVALDGVLFFFIALFQCSPPSAYWTLSATPQACIDEVQHLLAAGCINTTMDFLIVLVPIPYVRRLDLPRKQQIIVVSLFAGGLFVTIAGAVRTAVTFVSFSDPNKDLTWNSVPVGIASALELNVGIICASIPPIKPFFARHLPGLIGNPISWLSRPSQNRTTWGTAGTGASRKAPGPDFWLVTGGRDDARDGGRDRDRDRDPESPPPLVMQMRGRPPAAGMPTPVRPPRTPSTLRSLSVLRGEPPGGRGSWSARRSGTPSSVSTTSTAILGRAASGSSPDLNKPLPLLRSSPSAPGWAPDPEEESPREAQNMWSIYRFVPYEDGHISVHRGRRSEQAR